MRDRIARAHNSDSTDRCRVFRRVNYEGQAMSYSADQTVSYCWTTVRWHSVLCKHDRFEGLLRQGSPPTEQTYFRGRPVPRRDAVNMTGCPSGAPGVKPAIFNCGYCGPSLPQAAKVCGRIPGSRKSPAGSTVCFGKSLVIEQIVQESVD
jgi:hypothetical protein